MIPLKWIQSPFDDEEYDVSDVMDDGDDEEFDVDDDDEDDAVDVGESLRSFGIEFLIQNNKAIMITFAENLSLHSSSNHVKRREK